MKTYKEKAEEYVREKCPELMELSFGCEVEYEQPPFRAIYTGTLIHILPSNGIALILDRNGFEATTHAENIRKIIGHPIRLNDWLRVLRQEDTHVAQCLMYPDGMMSVTPDERSGKPMFYINLTTGQPKTEADYQAFCEIVGIKE